MNDTPTTPDQDALLRRLAQRRALARAVLLFERVWPAVWPALGLAGVMLAVALLDLLPLLPAAGHVAALAVAACLFLFLLVRGLRLVRRPAAAEADRRLEAASGLRHRPLAVLADRPAMGGGETLWLAHVARAVAQVGRLRVGLPQPGMAARDPRALRMALVVALVASLVIAGPETPNRLMRALRPGFAPAAAPPATQVQAWITPPAYTGLAPLFLKAEGGAVSAPAGSHLTVNISGGSGTPELSIGGHARQVQALDAASFQVDDELTEGGRLAVRRHGGEIAGWDLTVVADAAPMVTFPEPPGTARGNTRIPQTRLPWQVSHAYGVANLIAELRLRDRPEAPPLVVAIPLPGGSPKSAHGVRLQDLTPHPWAGLPVIARLVAKDVPGKVGTNADVEFVLPERRFQNPVARQLMAIRKDLSVKPDDRADPIGELDFISNQDEVWAHDTGGYINLRAIVSQLYRDHEASAVEEVQGRMWQLALHLEEGAPEKTAQELAQARQELRELMDAQKDGQKVDPADIDRKMRDVQEALQRHLQALAEQARRDPTTQQFDPDAQQLDARDMQRLADEARKAAQEGKMDEAREKMAELDQMLDQMQAGRPEHGKMTEQERKRAEKRQRGQQQMSALQDIVQREGALLDRAQGRADPSRQNAFVQRRPFGLPPPDPAPATPDAPAQRAREQRVQSALRRALGELMQQYGDLTGEVPPNLGDADTAMRDAGQALGQGSGQPSPGPGSGPTQDADAASAEQRAIEALQKGGRGMSQQMAQQFGRPGQEPGDDGDDGDGDQDGPGMADGQSGDSQNGGGRQYGRGDSHGTRPWDRGQSPDRRADDRRDPLGRPLKDGTAGNDESSDVEVPEKMEAARTHEIQEELRRRGAERSRPQPELDYIDRLLKQF